MNYTITTNICYSSPDNPVYHSYPPWYFQVNSGAAQYTIALTKPQHDDAIKQCSEYQLMQRAFIQEVTEAIDGKYLTCLRNRVTGQVPTDIRQLILSLFMIYAKSPQTKCAKS